MMFHIPILIVIILISCIRNGSDHSFTTVSPLNEIADIHRFAGLQNEHCRNTVSIESFTEDQCKKNQHRFYMGERVLILN